MKKLYVTLALLGTFTVAQAQNDTIWWDNFNGETWDVDAFDPNLLITQVGNQIKFGSAGGDDPFIPNNTTDTLAYSYDFDILTDVNDRSSTWFRSLAFADSDTIPYEAVIGSNSWFDAPGQVQNFFILPSFYCSADAELSWLASPFQTPLYLDGYAVVVSTSTNSPFSFTDTLFRASEYASWDGSDSASYSAYGFAPASGFVHGLDGTYIQPSESIARNRGQLRPFSIDLGTALGGSLVGQNVFIAFLHNSFDDNLLSIDNVLLTGTIVDNTGIEEVASDVFGIWPNPADVNVNVAMKLSAGSEGTIEIIDMTGKVVSSRNVTMNNGTATLTMDVADLSTGMYTVKLSADGKSYTQKLIKK